MSDDIYENGGLTPEDEIDSPIFIFPDETEEDDADSYPAAGASDEETVSTRLFASPAASDKADGSARLTFGRVQASKKEKEFVLMPFLDDPVEEDDDDEGEESRLTFGRVKATKKEKEFVFMPFLNISEEDSPDSTADAKSYVVRPDGTVFDEGMLLLPLSPLDDDDDSDDEFDIVEPPSGLDLDDDDIGIYVTDADPEDFLRRPAKSAANSSRSPSKKSSKGGGKKTSSASSQQRKPSGGSGKKGKSKKPSGPSAEEQFRNAMMNINPEIRRAAMRDPIQRAALEQAVRIALVQQAAQEAVAMTTGSPGGYGNFGLAKKQPSAPQKKPKKKRTPPPMPAPAPPPAMQRQSPASGINVRGFSFGGFGSTPAEYASPVPAASPAPAAPETNQNDFTSNESFEFNPGAPDVTQDPVLASLTPSSAPQLAPSEQQDSVLSAISGTGSSGSTSGAKTISSYSPAAIRAAMRAGIDLTLPQTAAAAASASQSSASAQKAKLLETTATRRSGCLIWLIVLFIVFFIGVLAIAVWPSLSTELKYQEASSMMAAGNYIAASELFEQLDDYKDSETKACEAIYTYAYSLQNEGNYAEAIRLYEDISNYAAASERSAECRYILGKQYIAAGDYAAAYDQLYLIPRYNDAGDLAMDSNYRCAMQLYEEENWSAALVRFGMYPEYLDSHSFWQICKYNSAAEQLEAKQYRGAYTQFSELSGYSDANYQAAVAQYYLLTNGDQSFALTNIKNSLAVIEEYTSQQFAQNIIKSKLYTGAKLLGSWYDEDGASYLILTADNTSVTLTLCLAEDDIPGSEVVIENILFDNNIAYYMSGDTESMAVRVEGFAPDDSASPGEVTIYCYSNGETYTLYKN